MQPNIPSFGHLKSRIQESGVLEKHRFYKGALVDEYLNGDIEMILAVPQARFFFKRCPESLKEIRGEPMLFSKLRGHGVQSDRG